MTLPILRPAREDEITEAADLFITAVRDLAARSGLGPPAYTAAAIEPSYRHIHRTGIFEVAEVGGRIAAIALAIVREHQWFLSAFWASPGLQRKGIGAPLLARVWEEGRRRGATMGFTWSTTDLAAMAMYMKLGMLPGYPILTFAGAPAALPPLDPSFEEQPLSVAAAVDIDARVRGVRREIDLELLLAEGDSGRLVVRAGRPVGYHRVGGGVVGPVVWSDPADGDGVLALALRRAAAQAPQIRAAVPGKNHRAILALLGAGVRLFNTSHLLCTEEPGMMDRYIPSGPSLF